MAKQKKVELPTSPLPWVALNLWLGSLTNSADVEKLLEVELKTKRRGHILKRIHQRLSALRAKEERLELANMSEVQPKGRPRNE